MAENHCETSLQPIQARAGKNGETFLGYPVWCRFSGFYRVRNDLAPVGLVSNEVRNYSC